VTSINNDPDTRVQIHQDLPAPTAGAQDSDAVVAHGNHVRQGSRDARAAPACGRGSQDDEFGAGPAVEVGDVYPREDGVAVCAQGCGAYLVCEGCPAAPPVAQVSVCAFGWYLGRYIDVHR
jgi:hypothetical protein